MRGMRATQLIIQALISELEKWLVPSTFLCGRGSSHSRAGGVGGESNRARTQACWARMAATNSESARGSRRSIRAALWLS